MIAKITNFGEQTFMDTEIDPKAAPYSDKFNRKLLNSPYSEKLDSDKYYIFLRSLKMQIKLYREESIPVFGRHMHLSQRVPHESFLSYQWIFVP